MTEQGPPPTSSGRCHGPGCTEATNSDFCSLACRTAWNAALSDAMGAVTYEEACRNAEAAVPLIAAAGWTVPDAPPGAEFPQVASENPQVVSDPDPMRGWVSRLFDRLFGRTT